MGLKFLTQIYIFMQMISCGTMMLDDIELRDELRDQENQVTGGPPHTTELLNSTYDGTNDWNAGVHGDNTEIELENGTSDNTTRSAKASSSAPRGILGHATNVVNSTDNGDGVDGNGNITETERGYSIMKKSKNDSAMFSKIAWAYLGGFFGILVVTVVSLGCILKKVFYCIDEATESMKDKF
ncbi:unnamed protein product [Owenia fusiformis]|uniref:Uncharacterized protein n=1 Tax=Owenia fusiformis TaxID=6347 RepID=A0A8J1UBY2_OWEFU|nr:unnamed protein product [Owenia fusiformis]